MADERKTLLDTPRKAEEPGEEPLRQSVRWAVQELMGAEASA